MKVNLNQKYFHYFSDNVIDIIIDLFVEEVDVDFVIIDSLNWIQSYNNLLEF